MKIKEQPFLLNSHLYIDSGLITLTGKYLDELLFLFDLETKVDQKFRTNVTVEIDELYYSSCEDFIDLSSNKIYRDSPAYVLRWVVSEEYDEIVVKSSLIEDKIIDWYLCSLIEESIYDIESGNCIDIEIPTGYFGYCILDIFGRLEEIVNSKYIDMLDNCFVFYDFENLVIRINKAESFDDLLILDLLEDTLHFGFKGIEYYHFHGKTEDEVIEMLMSGGKLEEDAKLLAYNLT